MDKLCERKNDYENYLEQLKKNEKYSHGEYKLKEGDIVLHEMNTFFLIKNLSKENCEGIAITPYYRLCDQRCAVFRSEENLLFNELWGALPFIYAMKISEINSSIMVGKINSEDFSVIKDFSENKNIPENYKGDEIDLDDDTFQNEFYSNEELRFEVFNNSKILKFKPRIPEKIKYKKAADSLLKDYFKTSFATIAFIEEKIKMIFKDDYVGKNGEVKLIDNVIYAGRIPEIIELDISGRKEELTEYGEEVLKIRIV